MHAFLVIRFLCGKLLAYFNVVCCTMLTSVIFLTRVRLHRHSLHVALSVAVITIHISTIEADDCGFESSRPDVGTCQSLQWTRVITSTAVAQMQR